MEGERKSLISDHVDPSCYSWLGIDGGDLGRDWWQGASPSKLAVGVGIC